MTQAAPSQRRHTIAANLFWFAFMFVLAYLAAASIVPALAAVLRGPTFLGLLLPVLIACAIATFVAGTRFVDTRADLPQRRFALTIAYVALAMTLFIAVPALMLGIALLSGVTMSPEASHSLVGAAYGIFTAVTIALPVNGAIAWFILGHLARQREN